MVVLGVGGVLLLATGWMAISRLGGSSASSEAFAPARRIDENALVAANAERPGETAVPVPAAADNAIEAASDDEPAGAAAAAGAKPEDGRSEVEEVLGEAEAAIEDAVQEVEEAIEGGDGDKPER